MGGINTKFYIGLKASPPRTIFFKWTAAICTWLFRQETMTFPGTVRCLPLHTASCRQVTRTSDFQYFVYRYCSWSSISHPKQMKQPVFFDKAVIATRYELEVSESELMYGRDYVHKTRLVLGPTHPPVQLAPEVFSWGQRQQRVFDQPLPSSTEVKLGYSCTYASIFCLQWLVTWLLSPYFQHRISAQ
jgi:hypothetical protein